MTKPWSTAEEASSSPGKSISFISTHQKEWEWSLKREVLLLMLWSRSKAPLSRSRPEHNNLGDQLSCLWNCHYTMSNLALFSAWFVFSENEQTQACENGNWFTFYSSWAHLFQVWFFWDVLGHHTAFRLWKYLLIKQMKATWNENVLGWLDSQPAPHLWLSRENQAIIPLAELDPLHSIFLACLR